jgi:hypothetical protein
MAAVTPIVDAVTLTPVRMRKTRPSLSPVVEWSLPFLGHRFIRGCAPEATPTFGVTLFQA